MSSLCSLPVLLLYYLGMGEGRSGIYHTYLIITITGNGPEEVDALALLISVSRKHTHTQLISVIWPV